VAVLLIIVALATGLRSWGLLSGELVWHPDERVMVVYPLNMLSGDLNPHIFSYPAFHFYSVAGVYGVQYLLQAAIGAGGGVAEWVAQCYLWAPETARDIARWVSVVYSVATVVAVGLLAGRLAAGVQVVSCWQALTSMAGLVAALLASVNVLLIRQAPLAATDPALAFWFVLAVLAALKLNRFEGLRQYLVAGAAVGVCAAIKYPGASVAAGVVAVHLLSGRRITDRRLWAAGAVSILVFLLLSPYTLLEFSKFREIFLFELNNAGEGRWGLRYGPFHQLTETLRHAAGLLAWLGWFVVCGWTVWKRPTLQLVVLAATLTGYAAVCWGNVVFARYVLPVVPLQLALLADGIVRGSRYLEISGRLSQRSAQVLICAVTTLLVVQPGYGAWHVARLQGSQDTRSAARDWVERHVPPGSTLCNFGGWAGDTQLNTFEHLWWRFTRYTRAFGERNLEHLTERGFDRDSPYYFYAVGTITEDQAKGSIPLIHARECSHVILHEHPLPYSQIDTLLRQRLKEEARQVATFDPGHVQASTFDPMDAYYIPLAGWAVSTAGPRIEVWDVDNHRSQVNAQSATSLLSRVLSMGAETKAHKGELQAARIDLARARAMEPHNIHALEVLAGMERDIGDLQAAASIYLEIVKLSEDSRAMEGLALLRVQQGNHVRAIHWYKRARRLRPRDASLLNNLAASYRATGHADTSRQLWQEALALQENYADAHFNLGTSLYLDRDPVQALPHLLRAVELSPDSTKYYRNAAAAHRAAGLPRQAISLWEGAVRLDTLNADTYFNVAHTYQYDLQDPESALGHWEKARELAPADAGVIMHGAQAMLNLGRTEEAVTWLQMFIRRNPGHARHGDMQTALNKIEAAQ